MPGTAQAEDNTIRKTGKIAVPQQLLFQNLPWIGGLFFSTLTLGDDNHYISLL